jgi:uncharacterized membrane protein YebE (DUF533 family)
MDRKLPHQNEKKTYTRKVELMEQNAKPVTLYTLGKLAYISRQMKRKQKREKKQQSNSNCARHMHETRRDYGLIKNIIN